MNQTDLRYVQCEQLIKDAFIELIEEKGYSNITIKELSKRAVINRKTFYNHYETLDDLLRNITRTGIDALFEGVIQDEENKYSQEEFNKKITTLLKNVTKNKRLITVFINDNSSQELIRQFGEQILQKIFTEAAVLHHAHKFSNVPIELLTGSITAIFTAVMKWYLDNIDRYSVEDAAGIFIELVSNKLYSCS